ncbi:KTSC domain-containing protein [Synechocystis sp. PCC 7509]|uniref:KTSC domain-containing protein n=1 Tax=Synechocystis sp. PCC 7509 TaxID=927677 RepID=UPI00030DE965|nr:KTSC domain-containing protein [Synechocystis sp. PCC 7509]
MRRNSKYSLKNAATQILTIKFNNGSIYEYQDISANIAQALKTKTLAGQYFNESIKDRLKLHQKSTTVNTKP